jgi:hypothetical protein
VEKRLHPSSRALATARHIAGKLDFRRKDIRVDERLYLAGEDDLLEVIRDAANPGRLLQQQGAPPPPTLVLPNLTINLSAQAEQIARGFAALTAGRIAAEIGKMHLVIERFVGAQKFATAQSAGAGSLS